ncbi:hypothetical protein HF521_019938, partial [Silurus meridionalis]
VAEGQMLVTNKVYSNSVTSPLVATSLHMSQFIQSSPEEKRWLLLAKFSPACELALKDCYEITDCFLEGMDSSHSFSEKKSTKLLNSSLVSGPDTPLIVGNVLHTVSTRILKSLFKICLPHPGVACSGMKNSSKVLFQVRGYLCRDIENTSTRKTASVYLTFDLRSAESMLDDGISKNHCHVGAGQSGSKSRSERPGAVEGETSSTRDWLMSSTAFRVRGIGLKDTRAGRILGVLGLGRETFGVRS